ncbi:unnamed protein product, partial [Prorocentrum cordatum]
MGREMRALAEFLGAIHVGDLPGVADLRAQRFKGCEGELAPRRPVGLAAPSGRMPVGWLDVRRAKLSGIE